jgi:hypothetical protein
MLPVVVCYNKKACYTDYGRQSLLQQVQAILQGIFRSFGSCSSNKLGASYAITCYTHIVITDTPSDP